MKTINLFFSLLFVCSTLCAGVQDKISAREVLSMNKGWKFYKGDIPFPMVSGHRDSYNNAKAGRATGAASASFDDSSWRVLDIPHDWAVEGVFDPKANHSQGFRERGMGWYRRAFRLAPEDKGKHLELQFDGIATHATIWVNGTILHRNWCGYTSMYIDITPYATYGANINTIVVRVDAVAQEGWWYEGAGIYRNAWLVKRSATHIKTDGVFANPIKKSEKAWEIPMEVSLYNSGKESANTDVESVLFDEFGKIITSGKQSIALAPLRDGVVKIPLSVSNPMLWDIENPILYSVKTTVKQNGQILDELVTKCGFRTIEFDKDKGFFLNGKSVKIKGVCNHQDHAGVGVAIPDAIVEFRMRRLKEMGVNGYRCAHNPPSKELLDICDSIGMLVMDENRLFNTSIEYVNQLEWLIKRDRNHPSVILWSVFNEEPMQGSENGYEMVRRMSDVVKKLDSTRPVTAAMNGGLFAPISVAHAVDVVGFNYQYKSYDAFHEANPDMKLTSSEDVSAFQVRGEYSTNRKGNIIDSYDTESANWGTTHRLGWKVVAERPFIAGCFVWTGFDYRGEPTPFTWPSASTFFGIMDLCGFPKMAFYLHQAQWVENRDILNLVPHWNWSADSIGKPIKVMAMSNADSVKLILNGKTISGQRVDKYEMNTWVVPYKPGKLEAIGYKNGKIVSRYKVETTGEPVSVNLISDRKVLAGDGRDAMPITVELIDAKGRHVPTANVPVEFSISGPAAIIGLGNGDPNSHEAEKGNKRSLFNGLAQVIIQSTEGAGDIVLTASAEGMKPARIIIPVTSALIHPFVNVEYHPIVLDKWTMSPVTDEKPDANQEIENNDMNSWSPVSSGEIKKLGANRFAVLRTSFKAHKIHQTRSCGIVFTKLHGKAEVWIAGKLVGTKTTADAADFSVDFTSVTEECEVRVLLEGTNIGLGGTTMVR